MASNSMTLEEPQQIGTDDTSDNQTSTSCTTTTSSTIANEDQEEMPNQPQVDQWDKFYMRLACLAALRSKDPSTPVGAVIVDKQHQIVGIGYNSMPYIEGRDNDTVFPWKGGTEANRDKDTSLKYLYVVHAAVNAIANKTKESVKGCTIYLTHKPDSDCAHAIIAAGIRKVKYYTFTRKANRESEKDIKDAMKLLEANKIEPKEVPMVGDESDMVKRLNKRIGEAKKRYADNGSSDKDKAAKDYIEWEEFFMEIARLSTTRPGDDRKPELVQGACIVNKHNQVMSLGYSGYPEDMILTDEIQSDQQPPYIAHAEYKAILQGPLSVRGCTLYVTKYPCNVCAKLIIQSGITEVIYDEEGATTSKEPKYAVYESSRTILTECLERKKKIKKFEKTK